MWDDGKFAQSNKLAGRGFRPNNGKNRWEINLKNKKNGNDEHKKKQEKTALVNLTTVISMLIVVLWI